MEPIIITAVISVIGIIIGFVGTLIAPAYAEKIKRKLIGPKLQLEFASPLFHKTYYGKDTNQNSVYYFLFYVKNCGWTQEKNVEVILENLYIGDDIIRPQLCTYFVPQNLTWAGSIDKYENINPNRKAKINLGHIDCPDIEKRRDSIQIWSGK